MLLSENMGADIFYMLSNVFFVRSIIGFFSPNYFF
jgi:hypothetical protein